MNASRYIFIGYGQNMRFSMLMSSLLLIVLLLSSSGFGQEARVPVQLRGFIEARTEDCLNPDCQNHAPIFSLVDEESGERVRIEGFDKQLRGFDLRRKVSLKGRRRAAAPKASVTKKLGRSTQGGVAGSGADLEIQELELLPEEQAGAEAASEEESAAGEGGEPPVANGANTLEMLSILMVFIRTDTHDCMTSETNARNLLFNNTNNANLGMQAITKGRYGLQLGNGTGVPDDHVIDLHLEVDSADHSSNSLKNLAIDKLFSPINEGGMGLIRNDWHRIMYFAPAGITDSGFSAYAYYPSGDHTTHGMTSVYGSSYGNSRMNGYLHELGHNFGFDHSTKGSEYGDRTCVMGASNNPSNTETYNGAKLLLKDWLDVFPNAEASVATDTTIDLYPLSSDPNSVNEAIVISFPGSDYSVSYHRNDLPYGYLSQGGDHDRVFIHRSLDAWARSSQEANLSVGGSHSGAGVVTFERYGPNNAYATISIDMDDGNAKPVADAQSVNVTINTDRSITLTGSDSDTGPPDTLTYSVVSNPSNGALSGTPPNLSYSPNTNYLGSDSFVFKVDDGQISSFATVTISVNEVNVAPVANNQSVNTFYEAAEPITLTGSDANPGDTLTYSIVTGPGNGTLSGTPPNLIYTPENGYSGGDSFTFKANDGQVDSNTATVTITVSATPNAPPTVEAGPDKTVSLSPTTLNGTSVTDPEHSPTYVWTDTGTGTSSGSVSFSDANALSPTATFTAEGTYVLRLTADDGYDQSYDEVTITVESGPPSITLLSPEDNSTGVIIDTSIVATFNEPITLNSAGIITVTDLTDDSSSVSITLPDVRVTSPNGNDLSIDLGSNLDYTTDYEISIDGNAIQDQAASPNAFPGTSSGDWTFSTRSFVTIIWVTAGSDGSRATVPTEWTTLLNNAGYTVTAYNGADNPEAADLAVLNAADLVVHGRGETGTGGVSAWDNITTPLIMMNPYSVDNWGWGTGNPAGGSYFTGAVTVPSGADSDAAWTGITINSGVTADSIFTSARSTSGTGIGGGGNTLGTAGSGIAIARWAAGTVATGERIFFTGHSGDEDTYNLTATGGQVFLNAVNSLLNLPTYTVTYDGNGSDGGAPPSDANSPYIEGASVTVIGNTGNLTRSNHSFAGWNTASDGSGASYVAGNMFTISSDITLFAQWTPTTFASWIDRYILDPSDQSPTDDPDGDGMNNQLEAFFGTDPSAANQGVSLTSLNLQADSITLVHPNPDLALTDISGSYEWSSDLVDWYAADGVASDGSTTVNAASALDTPSTNKTTVTCAIAGSTPSNLFLRVSVSQD